MSWGRNDTQEQASTTLTAPLPAVKPWFHMTADAQWIRPVGGSVENAVFLGLRNSIKFQAIL